MKKVLVLAYLYPPIFNSGTRRSLEFVNHLPDNNWTPTVLTVADPEPHDCDPALLAEVRPGTRIERVPLWSSHIARKAGALFGRLADSERIAAGLEWRIRRCLNVPDACASWVPMAVRRAVELHRAAPFDAIYATGWPWSSFLIAEKVSRLTGVPFVIDYRDLWKPSDAEWDQSTPLQRWLQPHLERKVLRRAAAVITTTKSFLGLLPQQVLPTHQFDITNGYDPRDFPAATDAACAPGAPLRIVYTGVWRPGYGPDDLYAAVQLLQARGITTPSQLKLVTAGFAPGRAAEYGIADWVEERGRISHAEALELMCSASAVYLPVSGGLYEHASIPGKLFDYLGCGRPILASAQPVSEVARTLQQVGGARRINPGDTEALAALLAQLCRGESGIFSARNAGELAMYTRATLTNKLAMVLNAVSEQAHGAAEPSIHSTAGP
jgi:hypothetical protein